MTIANRIINLRESHNLRQYELAEKLNMNPVVLNRIEKGTRPIRDDEIIAIASLFHVSADFLLGINNSTSSFPIENTPVPSLSSDEKTLLASYRQLNSTGKENARIMIAGLTTQEAYKPRIKDDAVI